MTSTRSAISTVDSRWAMMSAVRPARIVRSACCPSRSLGMSSSEVAAGYVVYGPSTVLVYTTGHGAHGFTLDPTIGAFVLTSEHMKMPAQGSYYSVNEANAATWPDEYRAYIGKLRSGALGRQ